MFLRPKLQRAIDLTQNKFVFLDNMLVVTTGKKSDHQPAPKTVRDELITENLAISWIKCNFVSNKTEGLEFELKKKSTRPLIKKDRSDRKIKSLHTI